MRHFLNFIIIYGFVSLLSPAVFACSVCFGDPNSNMSKGVQAGVYFLGFVIVFVLGWIAATIFIWSRRAKKIYGDIES